MKLSTVLGTLFILLFVGLPIMTGFIHIPHNLTPESLGKFLGEILAFWLKVLRNMIETLNPKNTIYPHS
jgi:hypothetical protein